MTLPTSGPLSMSQINAEFGRGNNLGSYRGTVWYTDAGASGTFSSGAISFNEFYGKRATNPSRPIDIRLYGARGGPTGYGGNRNNYGGYVRWVGTIPASTTTLTVYVGGEGNNGATGSDRSSGSGGGSSAVVIGGVLIAVAGGAGGGGGAGDSTGGHGGFPNGLTGSTYGSGQDRGGGGGTQSGPGAGGTGSRRSGGAGSGANGGIGVGDQVANVWAGGWGYGTGGRGVNDPGDGGSGGGGGGYFGGGGGGGGLNGAGGGGGSSFIATSGLPSGVAYSSSAHTTGANNGNGYVQIYVNGVLVATRNYTGGIQTVNV